MTAITDTCKAVTAKVKLTPLITANDSVTDLRTFAAANNRSAQVTDVSKFGNANNRNRTVTSGSVSAPSITQPQRLLALSFRDNANNQRAAL